MASLPFQPIGSAIAALAPRPGVGLGLPDAVIEQARLVAHEFVNLRKEHFGPDSDHTGLGALVQATESVGSFLGSLLAVGSEDTVIQQARLAAQTLREIRCLWQADHFFTDAMRSFFDGLMKINAGNGRFGEKLFRGLKAYRDQRDEAETRFLEPFSEYRERLREMLVPLGSQFHFSHWEIKDRIKRRILSKLEVRELQDMNAVYDILGLRILLGRQVEVNATEGMIRSALYMHEAASKFDSGIPYYFTIDHIERHIPEGMRSLFADSGDSSVILQENDRGYTAAHVNLRRIVPSKGKSYSTAEIQLKTWAADMIGEEQRNIAYFKKDLRIPACLQAALKSYGRAAFQLGRDLEEGKSVTLPQFDITKLDVIEDPTLRLEVEARLNSLEKKLIEIIGLFEKVTHNEQERLAT